jgi:hypothetical protein
MVHLSPFINDKYACSKTTNQGAGAGVSTEMLWKLGYRDIVAVDWSDAAWNKSVLASQTDRQALSQSLC